MQIKQVFPLQGIYFSKRREEDLHIKNFAPVQLSKNIQNEKRYSLKGFIPKTLCYHIIIYYHNHIIPRKNPLLFKEAKT